MLRHRMARWRLVLGVLVPLAAGTPAPLAGQGPLGGRYGLFEVPGLDFRPDGAWRRRTAQIRSHRESLRRQGQLAALNAAVGAGAAGARVSGTFNVPVVPLAFSNVAAPFPAPDYQDVLFAPAPAGVPYSVRGYYAEQSRGLVSLGGVVLDWVTADSTDAYYEDGCNGIGVLNGCPHGGQRLGDLLLEGLIRNDTGALDWGQFDGDGPDGLPNSGDDDGVVDFVLFLQPEVDGACRTTNLWAHRYDVAAWNGGSPYVTQSSRRDAAGQPLPGQFIIVREYTLQSAVGGPGACTAGVIMPIGTVAHETGHAFGLPDLYDTDLRSGAVTQGIGEWGIMGSGNYSQPYSPAAFDAWSLAELGWVAVDTLGSDGTIVLEPVAAGDTVLLVSVPNTDEYFLFENRQAIGSDSAQLNPGCLFGTRSCAKGPGLLVWHIDQGQVNAHGFRSDNRVNTGPVHGVALVQADGLNELRAPGGRDRGDAGDPWPGSAGNPRFGAATLPAALDNQGATAGFELDSIRQLAAGGAVAFGFTRTQAGVVAVSLAGAVDQILGRGGLLSAQIAYLDGLGNQNGRYDVGDFLAFLHSQGLAAPPDALQRALARQRRTR